MNEHEKTFWESVFLVGLRELNVPAAVKLANEALMAMQVFRTANKDAGPVPY